jgi:hypothetical protein
MKKENAVVANRLMYNCNFCGAKNQEALKCNNCGYPLSDDICYFELFLLPKQFSLNKTELYTAFLAMQQQFHPDKFLQKATQNQHMLSSKHHHDVQDGALTFFF